MKKKLKKIALDFFAEIAYPSHLRAKGDALYFLVKKPSLERNEYESNLFCVKQGKTMQLTSSCDVKSFALLEDGVVFPSLRSDADKEAAKKGIPLTVFQLLPYEGGEAREFLRLPYAVLQAEWLPGGRLLFCATLDHSLEQSVKEHQGDTQKAVEARKEEEAALTVIDELPFWFNGKGIINKKRSAMYYYDGKASRLLSDPFANVDRLAVSEDGTKALFTQRVYTDCAPETNALYLLDIESGAISLIPGLPEGYTDDYTFAGGHILALFSPLNAPSGMVSGNPLLVRLPLEGGSYDVLDASGTYDYHSSVGSDVKLGGMDYSLTYEGDAVSFVATLGHDSHIVRYDLAGGHISNVTAREGAVQEYVLAQGGYALIAMRGDAPAEVYTMDPEGNETQQTWLNKGVVASYSFVTPQQIAFTNREGTTIFGWVMPPAGYTPGHKAPAILDIHGGPKTAYGTVLFHEMQYWCAQGYAVLYCNPTGSDGRGDAFADIRGRYGSVDYEDIMQFVDEAIKRFDFIDPARLGVTGGSYGGFMTNWIIGHTNRFKAAVSQRSIANWLGFNNTSDIGYSFGKDQMQGTPWTDAKALWDFSPLKYADRVATPTLFIHSEEDYRCNMFEGIQMFYALRALGVATRLCLFKGENHELSRSGKPKNRIRRLDEITKWMDRYLKNAGAQ